MRILTKRPKGHMITEDKNPDHVVHQVSVTVYREQGTEGHRMRKDLQIMDLFPCLRYKALL